jgi:alpha-1,3-rhamnosyl/mannosyltransferase
MRAILDARTVNDHYPGIGRYTFELARALAPLTDLVLLINPLQASQELDLRSLNAERITVPPTPRSLQQQWVVPVHMRRARGDVYHSPYYLMPYAPGLPTVVTAYDLIPLLIPGGFSAAQRVAYVLTHQLAFRAARKIITLCESARQSFIERFHLPTQKIVAIPPGLGPEFAPQPAEAVAAFREQRLPREYVLTVGSNKPHKNLPGLIRAYAALPADVPPLVIAGPEDARYSEMRAAAAPLGERVIFLGRVAEAQLPLLYAGAALFVQPSLTEGFGLPVLEAMACGTPVACSEAPGLVEAAGSAAILFDPRQSEAITHALSTALTDSALRTDLRTQGLRRVQTLTWSRAAEVTLQVYTQAMASR